VTGWTWAAARRRGTSHVKSRTPCQDAHRVVSSRAGNTLIAVVSDGAGSAAHGGAGAFIAARTMAAAAVEYTAQSLNLPGEEHFWSWLDDALSRIEVAAVKRSAQPRDFAATLVMAIANETGAVLALVGDGVAGVRSGADWSVPSWPQHGEYASTTYFVTDEPAARLRIIQLDRRPDALVLMSDGLERLALDFAGQRPHPPFFNAIVAPVERSSVAGHDGRLSRSLATYIDSDAVNARTDDDKSLVIAVAR